MSVLMLLMVPGSCLFSGSFTWHNGREATGVSLAETRDHAEIYTANCHA
jgi:hypothetical protein